MPLDLSLECITLANPLSTNIDENLVAKLEHNGEVPSTQRHPVSEHSSSCSKLCNTSELSVQSYNATSGLCSRQGVADECGRDCTCRVGDRLPPLVAG